MLHASRLREDQLWGDTDVWARVDDSVDGEDVSEEASLNAQEMSVDEKST